MHGLRILRSESGFIGKLILVLLLVLVGWALYKGYLTYRGPSAKQVIRSMQK